MPYEQFSTGKDKVAQWLESICGVIAPLVGLLYFIIMSMSMTGVYFELETMVEPKSADRLRGLTSENRRITSLPVISFVDICPK